MAEYYTNGIGRGKKRRRRSYSSRDLALLVLDVAVTFAMLLLITATIVVVVCQYISPEKSGLLSVVALGSPIIYLLDIAVMFYWIVRWKWYRASVMVAMVVLGLFYLSRYYKIDIDREYETSYSERKYTKVMTYNVLNGGKEGLVAYIAQHNPDILCLQEMTDSANMELLRQKYNTVKQEQNGIGNHIFSRYKIIRGGVIDGAHRHNGVWADLKTKSDTLRVVSLHLQSTSIRTEDTQFIEGYEYLVDAERESKLRSIAGRLVDNNRKRAVQAEVMARFLAESPYKTIVCGDFNDVPLSYTYNIISEKFDDAFSKMANGFAYTYNTRYRLLRIDNILVSPSIEVVSYEVDNEIELSDHYPVISRVKFNPDR